MHVPFDIEAIPEQPEAETLARIAATIKAPASMSKPETIQDWHDGKGKYEGAKDALIQKAYLDTVFDGAVSPICSIAWTFEDSENVIGLRCTPDKEAEMLDAFFEALRADLQKRPPEFVGHNIGGFDLPRLYHRAVIHQVDPGFDFKPWGRHGQHYYDTMTAWAGFRDYVSLDVICKALGIPGKEGMTGADVWPAFKAGELDKILDYNKDDVRKVQRVWQRMTFRKVPAI